MAQCRVYPAVLCDRPLGPSLRPRGGRGGAGVARRRGAPRRTGRRPAVPSSAPHAPPPSASAWRAAPHSPARAPQPTASEPTQEGGAAIDARPPCRTGMRLRANAPLRAMPSARPRTAPASCGGIRSVSPDAQCRFCTAVMFRFCVAVSRDARSHGEEQCRVRSARSPRASVAACGV